MTPTRLPLLGALGACCLSLAALSPARAATFDWTYTGTTATDNASGTLTTGGADMGGFDVTAITGTYNGFAIKGFLAPCTCFGSPSTDNIVYPNSNGNPNGQGSSGGPGSGGLLDLGGLGLDVPSDPAVMSVNLFYNGLAPYGDAEPGGSAVSFGDFTLTATSAISLPGTLPLFAGGLGVLGLLGWRRKRKAQAVT